ncbi:hypothetical protein BD310DRAFT_927333, partial [Dichomitus squalens]
MTESAMRGEGSVARLTPLPMRTEAPTQRSRRAPINLIPFVGADVSHPDASCASSPRSRPLRAPTVLLIHLVWASFASVDGSRRKGEPQLYNSLRLDDRTSIWDWQAWECLAVRPRAASFNKIKKFLRMPVMAVRL